MVDLLGSTSDTTFILEELLESRRDWYLAIRNHPHQTFEYFLGERIFLSPIRFIYRYFGLFAGSFVCSNLMFWFPFMLHLPWYNEPPMFTFPLSMFMFLLSYGLAVFILGMYFGFIQHIVI